MCLIGAKFAARPDELLYNDQFGVAFYPIDDKIRMLRKRKNMPIEAYSKLFYHAWLELSSIFFLIIRFFGGEALSFAVFYCFYRSNLCPEWHGGAICFGNALPSHTSRRRHVLSISTKTH